MTRAHYFAFVLIESMLREDRDTLDQTVSEINSDEGLKTEVLIAVAAMLASAMESAHGPVGAVALLDQSRADFERRDGS